MKRAFRIVNWVVAALFLTSAVLQLNDPDPWRWVVLYGAGGAACLLHRRTAWDRTVAAAVALAALIWAVMLSGILPDLRLGDLVKTMKAEEPQIELGREFLGLLIVFVWMLVLIFRPEKRV